ncbi:MAG: hypothetical protein HYX56_06905 [Chloroflexi bacterium]|nr:hypothetical protein [Chloroflexota bacterium]
MSNKFVPDARFRALLEELSVTLREIRDMEPRVTDSGASDEEWTRAWGQYSGLISRIGHLQQQLLQRRMELLGLSKGRS